MNEITKTSSLNAEYPKCWKDTPIKDAAPFQTTGKNVCPAYKLHFPKKDKKNAMNPIQDFLNTIEFWVLGVRYNEWENGDDGKVLVDGCRAKSGGGSILITIANAVISLARADIVWEGERGQEHKEVHRVVRNPENEDGEEDSAHQRKRAPLL